MGGVKKILNVATGGIFGAQQASHAQEQAIQQQTLAMMQAQQQQSQAQQKALEMQEKAQAQADQANEKAQKESATLIRESKDKSNKSDLTNGLALKPKTKGVTLGNSSNLGTEEDEEEWF